MVGDDSQFIVEHINAMTTAREHTMLTPDLAQRYLESCEIAAAASSGWTAMVPAQGCQYYGVAGKRGADRSVKHPEQHLQRILGHLIHTISSVAWRQPHHGIWLRKISR
ncbi:hypothetical protein BANRA_00004 [Klebsiella pneumoniae]|nr:hypothetical protein BANRA_00004 [Klebsiella pneumoniae]